MAPYPKALLPFLLTVAILLSIAGRTVAGREMPTNSRNTDKKKPQSFIDTDRTFLIPGMGRFMLPVEGTPFDPFTYNPKTGTSGGSTGTTAPTGGINTGSGHDYMPGGDPFVPNPGVEVPIPGSGASAPAVTSP